MATKSYLHLSSSGPVMTTKGRLAGFFVGTLPNGASLTLRDSAQTDPGLRAGDPIVSICEPTQVGFYPFPVDLRNGLWCDLTPGLDVTFLGE